MTGDTAVMLLVVRCIYEVSVIHCLSMAVTTFCLQRYLGRMILCCMSCKVTRYTTMAMAAVTGCGYRCIRRTVVTTCTTVML